MSRKLSKVHMRGLYYDPSKNKYIRVWQGNCQTSGQLFLFYLLRYKRQYIHDIHNWYQASDIEGILTHKILKRLKPNLSEVELYNKVSDLVLGKQGASVIKKAVLTNNLDIIALIAIALIATRELENIFTMVKDKYK